MERDTGKYLQPPGAEIYEQKTPYEKGIVTTWLLEAPRGKHLGWKDWVSQSSPFLFGHFLFTSLSEFYQGLSEYCTKISFVLAMGREESPFFFLNQKVSSRGNMVPEQSLICWYFLRVQLSWGKETTIINNLWLLSLLRLRKQTWRTFTKFRAERSRIHCKFCKH